MTKEFVPHSLAVKLKVLGFDEPCFGHYSNGELVYSSHTNNNMQRFRYSAPLYQQAFRWFREKYDLYPSINIYNDKWLCIIKSTISSETEVSGYVVDTINNGHPTFNTYEESEFECLKKLIEIIENQK